MRAKSCWLVLSLVVFAFLSVQLALADPVPPEGGGGGGGNTTPTIQIYLTSPEEFVYTKSWNITTDGFTFYYYADTEPYYCLLIQDGQLVSDPVSVNNDTSTTFYSNTTLTEGWHTWLIYCDNFTSNATSEPRYISIDNALPTATIDYPANGSYINSPPIEVSGNGTGSPPDTIELIASEGQLLSSTCEVAGGYGAEDAYCGWDYDTSGLATGTVVYMNISINDSAGNSNLITGYSFIIDNIWPGIVDNKGPPSGPVSDLSPLPASVNVTDNYQLERVAFAMTDSDTYLLIAADMNISTDIGEYGINGTYEYTWFADGFDLVQGGNTEYQVSTYITHDGTSDWYTTSGLFDREGDGDYVWSQLIFDSNMELTIVDAAAAVPWGEDLIINGQSKFMAQKWDTFNSQPVNTSTIFTLYNLTDPVEKLNNPQLATSAVPSGNYTARAEAYDAARNMAYYQFGFEVDNTPPQIDLSADKTTVNNAGNYPGKPSPPVNFTANITEKYLTMYFAFVYDVSKNATAYIIPYLEGTDPYWFLWDTDYYTLDSTEVTAYDMNSSIAVAGYFVQNTTEGTEISAGAYFNKTTGEFMLISDEFSEYAPGLQLYANLSTFEPVTFAGVYSPASDAERTGVILTADDSSGQFELMGSSGTVPLVSTPSPAGTYTVYVQAYDSTRKSGLTGLDITIDNTPYTPPSSGGGGGGGGGAYIPPRNKTNVTEEVEEAPEPAPEPAPVAQPAPEPEPEPVQEEQLPESPTGLFALGAGIGPAIQSIINAIVGFFAGMFGGV